MRLKRYIHLIFLRKKKKRSLQEKNLIKNIHKIIETDILNPILYQEAFSFKTSRKKNYERLEFLGDSVLGTIVSNYLFQIYPNANEGFLTQLKSKIVNRKNLNKIGENLNLKSFIVNENNNLYGEDLSGNLLESFIGAIFLDFGYQKCEKLVLKYILKPKDIQYLENKIISYKSLLLEWCQKKKMKIEYKTIELNLPNQQILFRTTLHINNKKIATASDSSKKKTEEKAAQRAFYTLNKKEKIFESTNTKA